MSVKFLRIAHICLMLCLSSFGLVAQEAVNVAFLQTRFPQANIPLGLGGLYIIDSAVGQLAGEETLFAEADYSLAGLSEGISKSCVYADVSYCITPYFALSVTAQNGWNEAYTIYDSYGSDMGRYRPTWTYISTTAAYCIVDGLYAAAGINFLQEMLAPGFNYRALTANLSALFDWNRWRFGLKMSNLGFLLNRDKNAELPFAVDGMVSFKLYENSWMDASIYASAGWLFHCGLSEATALKLSFMDTVSLSAGYNIGVKEYLPDYFTTGISVSLSPVTVGVSALWSGDYQQYTAGVGVSF